MSTSDKEDKKYASSGIVFASHKDKKIVDEIKKDISLNFNKSDDFYASLKIGEYRELIKDTQDLLNKKEYVRRIANEIKPQIRGYIKEDDFLIQTNLYLRATRPTVDKNEFIGWHRESFYGPNMEKSINIWTPIMGLNQKNTLLFIPGSQNIPETDIVTVQENDSMTKKGSTGNVIGFLYSPKNIVSGVNLKMSSAMNVPKYHSSIFPGLLIHGSGKNLSSKIRFSLDFRILPLSAYIPSKSKQLHMASNKPYFELL